MKAAVIGGGVIGGGWAARFLLNGWDVNLFDPDPEAQRKIGEVLQNARASLPHLYETMLPAEGELSYCSSIAEAVEKADWVQESVPERLDVKHKVFAEILLHCSDAPVGSSTSGFKPSELANGLTDPGQIFVAHPFNPVYLLPLVELVPSQSTRPEIVKRAEDILTSIGMYPLHVRKEIDAHIADRLLEAVWREALWLIKDDVATTEEIDDAIRYGFGLRWAQMGLFETYRIAGGEAGMKHFIDQFGPCLEWPWTKLMDVPELTDELAQKIADQSDAQSGMHSIRELERIRDENLVGMLRVLKARGWGAGTIIKTHEQAHDRSDQVGGEPITTVERIVPIDWVDYNGHMNESRYGQVFSDAADDILARIGAAESYVEAGFSFFTVDIHIQFLLETKVGQHIKVETAILEGKGKKLKLAHRMLATDGTLLATAQQLLIHVSLKTRKSCEPVAPVAQGLGKMAQQHSGLRALPEWSGD